MDADAVLTSHVLDTAAGRPAPGVPIDLFRLGASAPVKLARAITDADGRCGAPLLTAADAEPGRYRLEFHAGACFGAPGARAFYDVVPVDFSLTDVQAHYHVPLVASPWGYSTYRGAPSSRAPRDDATELPPPAAAVPVEPPPSAPSAAPAGAGLTTHVIDIAQGVGAAGLAVDVFRLGQGPGARGHLGRRATGADGRSTDWLIGGGGLEAGTYELAFRLGAYYRDSRLALPPTPFFEVARVRFQIADPGAHHHVPLLAAPWGYTTYRGS